MSFWRKNEKAVAILLWSFVGKAKWRKKSRQNFIGDLIFLESWKGFLIPYYSQWSIGPLKLPAISICFGLTFQAPSSRSLPCPPHRLPFSSSCSWGDLDFSFPVVSISVHAWWHCLLVFWGCTWSNPTCAFLSGCRFSPVQLFPTVLSSLWPLASGCPWWTSGICWQTTAVFWRFLWLLSMSLNHTGGQTSRWCSISLTWSFWISPLIFLHTGPSIAKAVLAFPILATMSWSDPPSLLMLLPRYMKSSTSSIASPSSLMLSTFLVLTLITFVLDLLILRPIFAEIFASCVTLACMLLHFAIWVTATCLAILLRQKLHETLPCVTCPEMRMSYKIFFVSTILWLSERKAMSSAKSRSSRRVVRVHCMPSQFASVVCRIIQLMDSRNKNGDNRHPWRTPVSISISSESTPGLSNRDWNQLSQVCCSQRVKKGTS